MPDKSVSLSPSKSAAWLNCPGSVRTRTADSISSRNGGDIYAQEGTRAHKLAEAAVKYRFQQITKAEYLRVRDEINPDYEMEESAEKFRDIIVRAVANDAGAEVYAEQHVSLEGLIDECRGTADCIIYTKNSLYVIDYKYGKGVKVSAQNNPQLMLYGTGAYLKFSQQHQISRIYLIIIQPRLNNIDKIRTTPQELLRWIEYTVKPAVERITSGSCELKTGKWCQFCPQSTYCRAKAEQYLSLKKYADKDPAKLDAWELVDALKTAEGLIEWYHRLTDAAIKRLEQGEVIEGLSLGNSKSHRIITDPMKLATALHRAGYGDEIIYKDREVRGIPALEKTIGTERLKEIAGDYIKKPEGKHTIKYTER